MKTLSSYTPEELEEMAKCFVNNGLLTRHSVPCPDRRRGCLVNHKNYLTIDPLDPDFYKNANEVMRRWKKMDGFGDWAFHEWVDSEFEDEEEYCEKLDTLTDPEKFLVMIYNEIKEAHRV